MAAMIHLRPPVEADALCACAFDADHQVMLQDKPQASSPLCCWSHPASVGCVHMTRPLDAELPRQAL